MDVCTGNCNLYNGDSVYLLSDPWRNTREVTTS